MQIQDIQRFKLISSYGGFPRLIKQVVCLSLLFPLEFIFLSAQNYTGFNFQDGIWVEEELSKDNYSKFRQIYCDGDTIINSKSFYKLYESVKSIYYPLGYPDTTLHQYLGAIREDTSNRVFFKNLYDTAEIIIYDFNLQLGDTIRLWSQDIVVENIDSIEICGKFRKKYWITGPSRTESLIEGVGFSNGLLGYSHLSSTVAESYYRLDCYTEKHNLLCMECDLLFLNQSNRSVSSILFPNPAQNGLYINSTRNIQKIQLVDIMGKIIYTKENIKSLSFYLELKNYKPGMYVITLLLEDSVSYSTIVLKK
jgi:hypothetical protein